METGHNMPHAGPDNGHDVMELFCPLVTMRRTTAQTMTSVEIVTRSVDDSEL